MFANYKLRVLQDYREKKVANILSLRLIHPTPAKLKEECLAACEARYRRKDGKALKDFFGQGDDKILCLQAIKRCEVDRFRPLVNYLRELTGDTEDKNIELLAWLIDFELRPYEWGKKYDSEEQNSKLEEVQPVENREELIEKDREEKAPKGQSDRGKEDTTSIQVTPRLPASKFKTRRPLIIAGMLLLAIGAVIYLGKKNSSIAPSGQQVCMFWAGDHYQPIPCNAKAQNAAQVIPLDSEKLKNFRKITRPDTITGMSYGLVWYAKVNGTMEFYTAGGYHPIDTWLPLKPITDYIIRKYIHPVLDSAQASR